MTRIAVTGLGVVSPIGHGAEPFWEALTAGRCGIQPLELFSTDGYRSRVAAWIDDATLDDTFIPARQRRDLCRADRFALVACREALADSGCDLGSLAPERLGIALGAGAAGLLEAEDWLRTQLATGRPRRTRRLVNHLPDGAADRVARVFSLQGPRLTATTACSAATLAIGQAGDLLRAGLADLVVAGGTDALCRHTFGGFNALRALDPGPCRPFDLDRRGLSLGEGAGALVLEREDDAQRRGARVWAWLAGYGVTADAHHMTAPEPSGAAAERAMAAALRDGGMAPEEVDYINAHGTGTLQNDAAEAAGIHRLFGARAERLPTSASKSMLGHALGAAGALEAVATVLALDRQLLPPTIGFETPDPACRLDVVPGEARPAGIRAALSSSFAFGGNSACLAFRRR